MGGIGRGAEQEAVGRASYNFTVLLSVNTHTHTHTKTLGIGAIAAAQIEIVKCVESKIREGEPPMTAKMILKEGS